MTGNLGRKPRPSRTAFLCYRNKWLEPPPKLAAIYTHYELKPGLSQQ